MCNIIVHCESTQTERTDLIICVLWSTVSLTSHPIVIFIVTQKLFVAGIFISVTPAYNIALDCKNQGSLFWIWSKKLT